MSNNIEGKVVVITWASSGLGEAAAPLSPLTAPRESVLAIGRDRRVRSSRESWIGDLRTPPRCATTQIETLTRLSVNADTVFCLI